MQKILPIALIFLLTTIARAQPQTAALINEQLDKPISLELNQTLPEAMRIIGQKTGVRIEAQPIVWELLPWGDQTNINAKIENTTLRDALEAITRKLGLIFVLKDESLELQPMPALARLGRRATQQELKALDQLASTPAKFSTERPSVRQLIETVDQKLMEMKSPFAIESRPGDNVVQDQTVFVARNATLMDALEALHTGTRATWYPWGKSILIVPKEDQIRNQLSRAINVRYPGTDVAQVLTELSQKSGVNFEIEPGAISRIDSSARRIKLELYDASVTKALEAIAGVTGLSYVVNEKGVYIWNASTASAPAVRDPVMLMINIGNTQVLVPQSQIPPDVQEYLRAKMKQQIEHLRAEMQSENFKPTKPATQPTSRPSEDL